MRVQLKGKVVFFATNNVNKFDEARQVLAEYKICTGMLRIKTVEIQSESLEEIAETSVVEAFKKCKLPVIVEDAGLFVDSLNGFPGPYAAYVYRTISNKGLLRLMENLVDRRAKFQSVISYYDSRSEQPLCFKGEVAGEITTEERKGNSKTGFGFDPIFKPLGSEKTFAEMNVAEKNGFSHRAKATRKFAEWYRRLR